MGNHTTKSHGFDDDTAQNAAPPSSAAIPRAKAATSTSMQPPTFTKHMKTIDFLDAMITALDQDEPQQTDAISNNDDYSLKTKIRDYNDKDFDDVFDEISDKIDKQYPKKSKSKIDIFISRRKPKEKNINPDKSIYVEQIQSIKTLFKYGKQLGKGGTCRVLLVYKRKNASAQYALKELEKSDKYNEALFAKEIQLIKLLKNNVNVVDFYAAYQTRFNYYIATTYCSGGTFLDRILSMKSFSEKIAIKYLYIIISAVDHMHSRGIVHRDLKLNNMVFDKQGDAGILKIIDFGDGDIVNDNDSYKELVGTLYYLSPECKRSRKGWEVKKSDMWSIGIICYILLSGKLPFSGSTQTETVKYIQKAKFRWPENVELSDSCKSFIKSLICKSTKQRLSASEALQHEWINDYQHKASDVNLLDKIKTFLGDFNYNNKLHKILVNACLEEIDENEVKVIINAFHNIDVDKKGNINEGDICKYLMLNSNINKKYDDNKSAEQHAQHIFNVIEKNTKIVKSKSIPIHDFVDVITPATNSKEDDYRNKYKFIAEQDGDDMELKEEPDAITVASFKNIMQKSQKKYPVDTIIKDLDPQETGFISFQSISKFKKSIKTISYEGFDALEQEHSSDDVDVYQ